MSMSKEQFVSNPIFTVKGEERARAATSFSSIFKRHQTSLPMGDIMRRKRKASHLEDETAAAAALLLPGLPDHIAQICLSSLRPSLLYSVSHSWRRLLTSPSFPPYLSLYALLSPPLDFFSFDPLTAIWSPLPPRPPSIRLALQHKSFLSLNLPVQSLSVAGKLVVVAATDPLLRPALDSPLVFDPARRSWTYGPEMAHPRRWCAAGSSRGSVYVASGVGSQFRTSLARSVERWSFVGNGNGSRWEKMKGMKDGRLSREAIDAVGCRGKLYMVNVKGKAAKEGFVYDTARDEWEEMAEGMLGGWRGPAAAMDEQQIYVVDESRGVLMSYEWHNDAWTEVVESEFLKGAQQMAAGGGRVCVVVGGGGGIAVVDVACGTPRVWVVETPGGLRADSVHVLPRMVAISA